MDKFSAEHGERLLVIVTPEISHITGIGNFDARKEYIRMLLTPYRFFGSPHPDLFGVFDTKPKSQLFNVGAHYEQNNKLGAYGIDGIMIDGPIRGRVEQYEQGEFDSNEVLETAIGELQTGQGASSNKTTLAIFLIGDSTFKERIIKLLNVYIPGNVISPEVLENGQIYVLRLGFKMNVDNILLS